jgi:4-diphosphocytidyl-2-C-methyl-D-erythritol kinase
MQGESRFHKATGVITVLAPAKINLFLHVGERRDDDYHSLESLVVFAETADRLEFAPANAISLSVEGPFGRALAREKDNLVLKAARLVQSELGQSQAGARITLQKNLPVASGIGGGSADAAATLRGLDRLWELGTPEAVLLDLAARIGSDVPACLLSRPCWMEGRGERVKKLPALPQFPLVLVNPGVPVPTGPVFANLNARTGVGAILPPEHPVANLWDLLAYLADAGNDLEAPAAHLAPVIDDVLAALDREPGCALAQMSGSGATCFGLFHQEQFALGAAERIAQDHPDWWVRVTRLAAPDIGTPARA